MVRLLYCFLCLWISFPCLYFEKNWLISFFVLCLAKNSLCFIIESISCFRLPSIFLFKSKRIAFGSAVIASFLPSVCTPIIIITWLNCCKVVWWFYYADAEHMAFAWFRFLVCLNFQFLFVLIILEAWLIVCLQLWFLITLFFCPLHHFLVVTQKYIIWFLKPVWIVIIIQR